MQEGGQREENMKKGEKERKEGRKVCDTHSSPALHCHCRLLKPISVSVHVDACVESVSLFNINCMKDIDKCVHTALVC